MKITIKATSVDLTPSLRIYIEKKLDPLSKLIERLNKAGQAELWLEIARTTRHHRKGGVFRAEADLRLPKHILRAEETSSDLRAALGALKDKLRVEIEKYRTRFLERLRREGKV